MILNFIAYLIISIAFSALIIKILQFFNFIGKKTVNASKCPGCSTDCEMKELKQFRKDNPASYDQYRMQL